MLNKESVKIARIDIKYNRYRIVTNSISMYNLMIIKLKINCKN
jgi:hypothetical protein